MLQRGVGAGSLKHQHNDVDDTLFCVGPCENKHGTECLLGSMSSATGLVPLLPPHEEETDDGG